MGPQWTLSKAFDLLSGRTEFQTQNGLEVKELTLNVVFSVLPGCYVESVSGVCPWRLLLSLVS